MWSVINHKSKRNVIVLGHSQKKTNKKKTVAEKQASETHARKPSLKWVNTIKSTLSWTCMLYFIGLRYLTSLYKCKESSKQYSFIDLNGEKLRPFIHL